MEMFCFIPVRSRKGRHRCHEISGNDISLANVEWSPHFARRSLPTDETKLVCKTPKFKTWKRTWDFRTVWINIFLKRPYFSQLFYLGSAQELCADLRTFLSPLPFSTTKCFSLFPYFKKTKTAVNMLWSKSSKRLLLALFSKANIGK